MKLTKFEIRGIIREALIEEGFFDGTLDYIEGMPEFQRMEAG